MGKIYIVGLGPGSIEDLTLGAINRIKSGKVNLLRTENHPTVKYLTENNISYKSYDYLYDSEEDFQELYSKIADEIVRESELYGEVNYLVPGNPMVAEKTVEILLKKDLDIEIISGMSFIEPILEALNRDPINGLKIVDATKFTSTLVDINVDILITQVYNKRIISDIKIVLSEIYGDEYSITVIHNAGIEGEERIHNIPIYLIDRIEDIGYLTSIYLPKIENPREVYDINNLIEIMRVLRGEDGCPWDIKQDHKSLRQTVIEEAYEVADAIDRDDVEGLIEELGIFYYKSYSIVKLQMMRESSTYLMLALPW